MIVSTAGMRWIHETHKNSQVSDCCDFTAYRLWIKHDLSKVICGLSMNAYRNMFLCIVYFDYIIYEKWDILYIQIHTQIIFIELSKYRKNNIKQLNEFWIFYFSRNWSGHLNFYFVHGFHLVKSPKYGDHWPNKTKWRTNNYITNTWHCLVST